MIDSSQYLRGYYSRYQYHLVTNIEQAHVQHNREHTHRAGKREIESYHNAQFGPFVFPGYLHRGQQ